MKLSGLTISFLAFTTTVSAQSQNLQSTFKTNDVEVNKAFVAGNIHAQTAPQQAEKLLSVELPVILKTFQVDRLGSKVDLVWETTAEMNNAGFEIQRRTDKGEWQKVAFVFSQAANGNSKTLLTYAYTDVNIAKDGSEYRLRQMDRNNQTSYSKMHSVGGYLSGRNL
jgi:hypothetical protein